MGSGPRAALLADGRRLHLQHGPIDLVIEATGGTGEVSAAYDQARACFGAVLRDLVNELPALRSPARAGEIRTSGPVARRMEAAVEPHAGRFITPMAAVAGAVADHVLAALREGRRLRRAYVNNGGDIALYLAPGARFKIGIVSDPRSAALAGSAMLESGAAARGIATSGRHGRSHSLGIADAVTVLALNAAQADAAATLIANAVDLPDSPLIERVAAWDLSPDSDLGARLVTVAVAPLRPTDVETALDRGVVVAEDMRRHGLLEAAWLSLRGVVRICGASPALITDQDTRIPNVA
jgi:ApbE superfamily uncharacterized protein (UPF0280 family)